MSTVVVLAVHGSPPLDFPRPELMEFMGLHARLEAAEGAQRAALSGRYEQLEKRVRTWPRTPANDPFHAGTLEIAGELERAAGLPVVVGFNEFCSPSLEQALQQAAGAAERVLVVTPMLTRGGEHAERDIPAAIARARARHPSVEFRYAWPFAAEEVAGFLASRLEQALPSKEGCR